MLAIPTPVLYITFYSLYYAFIPISTIVPTIALLYIFCGLECTFKLWRVQCHHVCVILCLYNIMYYNTTIIRDDILTLRWNAEPIRGSDSVNIIMFTIRYTVYLIYIIWFNTFTPADLQNLINRRMPVDYYINLRWCLSQLQVWGSRYIMQWKDMPNGKKLPEICAVGYT